ncbi:MAG: hypothetical protein IT204_15955 [Fimbriimonadaceae bacterium]|nr:hypothetical protein [Fimbriimonadaceae bacterium]
MANVDLAQMRQHYRAAAVDSEEHAQRLLSLGIGAAAAVLFISTPAVAEFLQVVWLGATAALVTGFVMARRKLFERLRQTIFEQQLQLHTNVDRELWDRVGRLEPLPQPLQQYVEHFLSTYTELKSQVREGPQVELGQVQLLQAREQVIDFIDLAERTGRIRKVLDTQSHRLSDDDQVKLRQLFSEQCSGLQDLAQSFDRSLANLLVAQVLGEEMGETSIAEVSERMRAIEDELDHVKQSLAAETR